MPKVSVIMPVYNTEKYLKESVESILNQDFSDFEFLIFDDCSTDKSFEILENFAKNDERIRLFRGKKNKGITFVRNFLIKESKTNFIVSQDSDDISAKNRISLEYDFLEKNPDFAVVSGNTEIIDEDSKTIGFRKYSPLVEKNILKKMPICNGASMFKKDVFLKVGGYDENFKFAEDYDLTFRIFASGYKIGNLDNYFLKLRIRSGQSKSKNLKETLKNTIFLQKRAIKEYKIKPSFSDKIYIFLEQILLLFPDNFIFFLFKKLTYKNDKK